MREKTYKAEAIILARRNIGEADRLLTVFSKHNGKLRIIAKGVRRPTSRKRGSLELFACVRLFLVKGKTFDIVTEVELKENFNSWRESLVRVGVAYHLAEVVSKLTREDQENKVVYGILFNAFSRLHIINYWQLHHFISEFKRQILVELGFLGRSKEEKELDDYIEELTQSKLRTKRFLRSLS